MVQVPPGRAPGGALGQPHAGGIDQREPGHADAAVIGRRVEVAKGIELLQEQIGDAGLLRQLAHSRLLKRLAVLQCASGDRPLAFLRRSGSLDQQHLQRTVKDREYDNQNSDGGPSRIRP